MHSPTQWFVLGLVLTVHSVTAQVFAINHIDTPHEGIPAGEEFSGYVTWTEPSGVPPFTARNLDFEFLSGVSNVAVDIISLNKFSYNNTALTYHIPRSLPPGLYRFRVNITDPVTSALSDTFTVLPPTFNCIPFPPWVNVTSPSDPSYKLLRIFDPPAGSLHEAKYDLPVSWNIRDIRFQNISTVQDATFEYISSTGKSVGAGKPTSMLDSFADLPPPSGNVDVGGWKIRINYTNPLGGGRVSASSEVFNFVAGDYRCEKNGTSWTDDGKAAGGSGGNGTSSGIPSGVVGGRSMASPWLIMVFGLSFLLWNP